MRQEPVADLSRLPTSGFGPASPMWWGTLGFIALEGTGFAIVIGAYLYLAQVGEPWPLGAAPPGLAPGSIVLLLLFVSLVPNHFASRWARGEHLAKVRLALIAMCGLGLIPLAVRWFEFAALGIRWDQNAYGSMLWLLLGLHTAHLITDVIDTLVLTALMFTRHGNNGRRFSDVNDNAFYWDFVVLSWVPIYLVVYWVPRL
jgi:heme/copper-type cytochrome/quinol oxidase subunit 3